jgi:hypothetical protein
MKRILTVGYQYRQSRMNTSGTGPYFRDLPTVPKITIINHILEKVCDFSIGDKVEVEYLKGQIIITKFKSNV